MGVRVLEIVVVLQHAYEATCSTQTLAYNTGVVLVEGCQQSLCYLICVLLEFPSCPLLATFE